MNKYKHKEISWIFFSETMSVCKKKKKKKQKNKKQKTKNKTKNKKQNKTKQKGNLRKLCVKQ